MSDQIKIGDVEVLCLTDANAALPIPITNLFPGTSEDDWKPFRERYPEAFSNEGFGHVHFGCYLVRSGGKTVLIDTGLGGEPVTMLGGIRGELPDDLARKGVPPDAIDTVFHTHLHFDHVGWNIGEGGTPRFPKARYVCHQADWDFFKQPEVQANFPPGSFTGPMEPLEAAGVLDLVSGEHTLAPGVTAIPTPGHTPGHMSVLVSSGGEKALITGDTLASPAHITNANWAFGFDSDPATAIATRSQMLDRIEAEGMKIIACHLPCPGFGTIVRLEGKRYWQGI